MCDDFETVGFMLRMCQPKLGTYSPLDSIVIVASHSSSFICSRHVNHHGVNYERRREYT